MASLSRVEKRRFSKRAKSFKMMKTGIVSTLVLGLAGCVQSSAAEAFEGEATEQINDLTFVKTSDKPLVGEMQPNRLKVNPHYLYSIYENDDVSKEVKVYGFKNTLDPGIVEESKYKIEYNEYINKSHLLSSPVEEQEKIVPISPVSTEPSSISKEGTMLTEKEDGVPEKVEIQITDNEVIAAREEQSYDIEEPHLENDTNENENTTNNETTQTDESKSNDDDQEQQKAVIERNNHGKVLSIEGNRFAIETEEGPKWFVADDEQSVSSVLPGMAVSVYFQKRGNENLLLRYFITYTPNEGERTEFVEAHFLQYAGEPKRSIVVYIPHQQVIFNVSAEIQTRNLEAEFATGAPITLGIITQADGSMVVESISHSL